MKTPSQRTKVLTVVGTRPEIIRLSQTIKELDRHFDHTLIHTGQNYDRELSTIFFEGLDLRAPDRILSTAGETPAQTVAAVISQMDAVLEEIRPDALLILGDTNSAFAAYPAKRRKIPVFHMEAGNRCFDERTPEEINRRIIDHMSDINLVYSDRARDYLLREGCSPDRVIKTGSPMYEVLEAHRERIESCSVLSDMHLEKGAYFVLSCHREENVEGHIDDVVDLITALAERGYPVIFSMHPRTKKAFEQKGVQLPQNVFSMKPLGFIEYVALQKHARCVVSDSGTLSEESSILGFPAVNIRESHERLEAMDEAAVPLAGLAKERMLECIDLVIAQSGEEARSIKTPTDYSVPNVSAKVSRIILSHIDYVKRVVWSARSRTAGS